MLQVFYYGILPFTHFCVVQKNETALRQQKKKSSRKQGKRGIIIMTREQGTGAHPCTDSVLQRHLLLLFSLPPHAFHSLVLLSLPNQREIHFPYQLFLPIPLLEAENISLLNHTSEEEVAPEPGAKEMAFCSRLDHSFSLTHNDLFKKGGRNIHSESQRLMNKNWIPLIKEGLEHYSLMFSPSPFLRWSGHHMYPILRRPIIAERGSNFFAGYP